jgi:dTDP-glucose 4,6-dehydratase
MRIVISGAAGFIGSQLCNYYLEQGHRVVGLDNFLTGDAANIQWLSRHEHFTFVEHDITHALKLEGPVDLVCNLACPASPVDFAKLGLEIMMVCSEGTRHMLDLAREKGAVLLHTSTSEVYGDPVEHPQNENYWGHVNPIGPRSVYDEGKRYAEAIISHYRRRLDVPVRIARIFNTYGPRMRLDDGRVVTNFIAQALAGQPLTVHGDGSQTRSFCYVDDTVRGLAALADNAYQRPINIGNPSEISILQLAREIIELTGSSSRITESPASPDDPQQRRPDINLAKELLGWQPYVDRNEGLRLTCDYYRQAVLARPARRSA